MLGRGKKETSDGLTFQISHQAFSCIICKSIHVLFYKMDKTIASFFYENCISFNVADSSSFALMIEETQEHEVRNKIHFKVTKPLPTNNYLGSSLTKHTGQLSNLQLLFLLLLKSLTV